MSPVKIQNFILPKVLTTIFIVCLLGAGTFYVLYQARFLIQGPQVTLFEIPETVQSSKQVVLQGNTSNITALYLNGRSIVTNEDGVFSESVVLENGYSIVRIDAEDRYGRTTSVEHTFVYTPEDSILN